jgi:polysaccharide biosynthesis/export protein
MNDQDLTKAVQEVESNYVIQKNDQLKIGVFTNVGEQIVDPVSSDQTPPSSAAQEQPSYQVDYNGVAKFPLVNELKVEGLTLREAEKVLEEQYGKFYKQPFVRLQFTNKRVVVLGITEGGTVVPLTNENMKLTEVLALSEGIDNNAKVGNIRLLRGKEVLHVDLSTIDGYKKYNYTMQPNDIIYVEPIRRPVAEAFRDYGPVISVVSSLTALVVVLLSL